jgi:pimeloyl-ACP methyl ester carboxylesterase
MQAVSTSYRSYAIDFWGFGGSAKEPTRYLLSHQRDLVHQFMYEMGIGKIALIGHGLGAVVGLIFSIQYPALVDRIMAISLPLETSLISPRFLQSSLDELADWLLGGSTEADVTRKEAPKADQDAVLRTLDNLRSIELTQLPNRLVTPCLLVNGMNDPAIYSPSTDKISSLPSTIHHISFNQSGHFPMLDQPNKFNRLIIDFLSLESGKSPSEVELKEEWKRRLR